MRKNFSRPPWISNESECTSFFPKTVSLQYSSTFDSTDSSDGLLVAAAVLNLVVCPFTILLNALVMIAVKTRRRLQTHPVGLFGAYRSDGWACRTTSSYNQDYFPFTKGKVRTDSVTLS